MKYLTRLKLKANRVNKLRADLSSEIKMKNSVVAGFNKQLNDVDRVSPSAGKIARADYNNFNKKQAKNLGSAYNMKTIKDVPKSKLFSSRYYKTQAMKVAQARSIVASESLAPNYDAKGINNLITSAVVKSAKKYGVKIKKVKQNPNERPVYKVDYSAVPKDKKKEAKVAIRRGRRRLSSKGVNVINKLMALVKKTYYGNVKIQDSDQVFEAVIDVAKNVHGDVTADNASELVNEVMNRVNGNK